MQGEYVGEVAGVFGLVCSDLRSPLVRTLWFLNISSIMQGEYDGDVAGVCGLVYSELRSP